MPEQSELVAGMGNSFVFNWIEKSSTLVAPMTVGNEPVANVRTPGVWTNQLVPSPTFSAFSPSGGDLSQAFLISGGAFRGPRDGTATAGAVDPSFVIDAGRVHDEGVVVLPFADRITEPPGRGILRELSPIGPEDSPDAAKLV